jgi:hypothetical protein
MVVQTACKRCRWERMMGKRVVLILVALCLLAIPLAGCKKAKIVPTVEIVLPTAVPTATATLVPPTATPVPPTPVPTATEVVAAPEETAAPQLLDPPDEAAGTLFDLTWAWEEELVSDAVYVLWVWPDDDDVQPQVYGLYRESPVRITSANLPPGRYRWQVVVAKQASGQFTDFLSPFSELRIFILTRPSLMANLSATPPAKPTATASPTATPTRTATPIRYITVIVVTPTWTRTPSATSTSTPVPPTSTPIVTTYPGVTPTATTAPPATTAPTTYPGATATTAPPTATTAATGYPPPAPTSTTAPPVYPSPTP